MAQTVVDLLNGALQQVGANLIRNLTDNTKEARQCAAAYDGVRRSELRKNKWNFSIKRVALSPDADAPAFDFTYQFTLPEDCLRVLPTKDASCDWVIEGRKILTNDATVNLRYIADVTDVSQWDSAFYDAMSIAIAIEICDSLTNSPGKKQNLLLDYQGSIADAKKANAFEQIPVEAPDDSLWLVRF